MTDRIPYTIMKKLFDQALNSLVFTDEAIKFHGWSKEEFINNLEREILASAEEEYYEFTFEAPDSLQ